MSVPKANAIRFLRVKKTDDLKTIYAKAKKAFTAADLQKFTETKPGISEEQLVAELAAIHKEEMKKLRKRKKRA